jgi:hypothetical protein
LDYFRLLIKTARKLEDAQRKLDKVGGDGKPIVVKTPGSSPGSAEPHPKSKHQGSGKSRRTSPHHPKTGRHLAIQDHEKPSDGKTKHKEKHVTLLLKNLKLGEDGVPKSDLLEGEQSENNDSGSSCETLTSSSEDEDESDDDGKTVILGRLKEKKKSSERLGSLEQIQDSSQELENDENIANFVECKRDNDVEGGSQTLWKSGALFTLHSFGSEDKPLHSEEWVYFLIKTMKVSIIEIYGIGCTRKLLAISLTV